MAKSWQMCYIIRCDMVVTLSAALQRPIDPSQLLSRQHAANLRERQVLCLLRGNMSVTLSGSQLCEQTCLHSPSALRWRPGTLAEGLFPSRKHTSTTRVKLCQTKTSQYRYPGFLCNRSPLGACLRKQPNRNSSCLRPVYIHTVAFIYTKYVNCTMLFRSCVSAPPSRK